MIDHDYPRFEELGIAPNYLWIGANAIHNLRAVHAPLATDRSQGSYSAPQHRHRSDRVYISRYVGVRLIRGRYVGCWGPQGHLQGRPRPPTPEGELDAAWDRAEALGRNELELRP